MPSFNKTTENYNNLASAAKVALFKSTAVDSPTTVDLKTIEKFKVLVYKETT